MTRFALALAAILLLALSTSFMHTQLDQTGATRGVAAPAALVERRAFAADAGLALQGGAEQAIVQALPPSPPADRPAPALLVYLGLVLVGSAISVAIVRRSQGREL